MSKEFTIDKTGGDTVTADIANKVIIDPRAEEIIFSGNTESNYKKLIRFFEQALGQADDEKGIKPNFTIIKNDETKELSLQGDSEYVVKMCKRLGLIDEKTATEMLSYLNNPDRSGKCIAL